MNIKRKKIIVVLTLTTIIIMGFFSFLKPDVSDKQFVSEKRFNENRIRQMQMTPQTIAQLRTHNVTEEKELKLEYFFYTNTGEKAEKLARELKQLNYSVSYGVSAGDKKLFIVNGWTNKMQMAEEVVIKWTKEMCELGYKFDCEFDGWGTEPDQE